jgi:predicted nucleic acid-binding protein
MTLVLVDSSAWVHYLRAGDGALAAQLEKLLDDNRAALCGMVLTEVRQGLRPHEERIALDLFETLPYLETTREDYERAGELLATLRRQGITIPAPDGVIAALCLRHDLELLEHDKHFEHLERLKRIGWRNGR